MSSTATALTIVERVEQSAVVAALESKTAALMDLLPDEAAVSRFKRGVIVAITKNPDLMTCTPDSIVMACFEAASQGLEPTGAAGGAHLVPYKVNGVKIAQLIPDYRGVIRMVTKPGSEVLSIEARVVKEGDEFAYSLGTDAFVNHVPAMPAPGEPARSERATTHAYAIARLKNGSSIPDVEDRAGIERIRKRGANSSQSPWASDWDEMAKKTLIKRLSKVLPVRPDVRAILVREDELEGSPDVDPTAGQQATSTGPTKVSRLGSRLRNVTPPEDAPGAPASSDPPTDTAEPAGAAGATDADDDTSDGEFTELPSAAAAPAPEPIALEAFLDTFKAEKHQPAAAKRIRESLFGETKVDALTDEQRGQLLAEIRSRADAALL